MRVIATAERYQVLPPLTDEEYEALKADIAERGVQVPVEYDGEGNILDGYHRVRACLELGITDWPRVTRHGLSEEEKVEHALALNVHRRHLTREQRRELVARLRVQGWSLRRIAERLGISDGTVRNDLDAAGAQNYAPATVTGSDGKQYPATQPAPIGLPERREAEAPAHDTQPVPAKVEAGFVEAPAQNEVFSSVPEVPAPRIPHVAHNAGDNEWYTPAEYIEAARDVMGGIDLDPASSDVANEVVRASQYYTAEQDGLKQEWSGRVWMNPPYSQPLIAEFCATLIEHHAAGKVPEACVLVNNATETKWFQALASVAKAVCFPEGRIRFWAPGKESTPLQGQAVLYLGPNVERFVERFASFGVVMRA